MGDLSKEWVLNISFLVLGVIAVVVLPSHVQLFSDFMDCSPPGFSVHGIFQARILSGLPFPPPGDLPDSGIKPTSPVYPARAGRFFTSEPPGKPLTA